MLNLKNTLDGYLKNVEVIGNTLQDTNNLANIRSVGDKVEGQELYKIPVVSCGKNLFDGELVQGSLADSNGIPSNNLNGVSSADFICVDNNMSVSYIWKTVQPCLMKIYCYDIDYNYLGVLHDGYTSVVNGSGTVSLLHKTHFIKFRLHSTANMSVTDDIQVHIELGTQATSYEPYQEQKLEILSPVQLEKVGNVADRIVCKDGVWGVEKNITKVNLKDLSFVVYSETNDMIVFNSNISIKQKGNFYGISNKLIYSPSTWDNSFIEDSIGLDNTSLRIFVKFRKNTLSTLEEFNKFKEDLFLLYQRDVCEFISLPHNQQVKLRTFAGQTNIAFLTEISGQIKAQVPKSLGATVNTHTEQIKDLHNSLDRVKKLEETTVSTVETESSFTTVNETSNGYFEDVKLEGKTLVNVLRLAGNWFEQETTLQTDSTTAVGLSQCTKSQDLSLLKSNTTYTVVPFINYTAIKKGNLYIQLNTEINGIQNAVFRIDEAMFNKPTLITTKELTNKNSRSLFLGGANCEYKVKNVKILMLEGDHTNNPPSYFEGLMSVGQDVEEVSVESVNENLFSSSLYKGVLSTGTGAESSGTRYAISGYFICPYDNIYFGGGNVNQRVILHYDKNKNYIGFTLVNSNSYCTLPANSYYARIRLDINGTEIFDIDDNLKINLSRNNTEYIPHQVNKKPLLYYNPTTETWENPVLREWDTIEKHLDGKYYYHKRSGEVVLNGNEAWAGFKATDGVCKAYTFTPSNKTYGFNNLVCDRLPVTPTFASDPKYTWGISGTDANNALWVSLNIDAIDLNGFKAWLQTNNVTVVYQLAQEEVYECTNIDLMTYSGETNYIINSGAISPKSLLKIHNNISNVVKILQEKVSLLENTFIAGLKSVLSGDMYSLATILYPEDFEQNDNTEQDIMVIPE